MKRLALILPLLLCACTTPLTVTPIKVLDADKFAADKTDCLQAVQTYQQDISPADTFVGFVEGGLKMIGYVLIQPFAPVVNAVGGAGDVAITAYDPTGHTRATVYKNCVIDETNVDHSAIIAKTQ